MWSSCWGPWRRTPPKWPTVFRSCCYPATSQVCIPHRTLRCCCFPIHHISICIPHRTLRCYCFPVHHISVYCSFSQCGFYDNVVWGNLILHKYVCFDTPFWRQEQSSSAQVVMSQHLQVPNICCGRLLARWVQKTRFVSVSVMLAWSITLS